MLKGVENASSAGFSQVKVNMVVQKGLNEASILPMVDHFIDSGVVLRFIEFMDVGNTNDWRHEDVYTAQQIKAMIESKYRIEPMDANYRGEVAKRWRLLDQALEIGIISSVTEPFCGECSRARLSAIGELFTCLFADRGYDLRAIMRQPRSETSIRSEIQRIWQNRADRYSELRNELGPNQQKVEMSYIGG